MGDCKVSAVLLDTVSIQKYIFSGRKLKEFVGASYIVNWIYDEPIKEVLNSLFPSKSIGLECWENNPEKIDICNGDDFEVGYIGGGNALLFFKDEEKAKQFINKWTLNLLYMTPGLIPACALINDFDFNNYQASIKRIFDRLEQVKTSFPANVLIPRHGISAECQLSGGAKEVWYNSVDPTESGYISSILKTKLDFAETANKKFEDDLIPDAYKTTLAFTTEIDKLGQKQGEENYIAIVHADGNSTGKLFRSCNDLNATRKLSHFLKTKTKEAMCCTINDLIEEIKARSFDSFLNLSTFRNKTFLPIRPLIVGGDDITFVSHGKLGIWLAERLIKNYQDLTGTNDFNHKFTLSAGVLIAKAHMPFYRAYRLAEDLCGQAKKKRRASSNSGNWLDFHIAYGGFTGTIEDIRRRYYRTPMGELCLRPLKVGDRTPDSDSLETFIEATKTLSSIPRSKVMELRKVLAMGDQSAGKILVNNLSYRGQTLPPFPGGSYKQEIWVGGKTPYFDMIELLEFYPI